MWQLLRVMRRPCRASCMPTTRHGTCSSGGPKKGADTAVRHGGSGLQCSIRRNPEVAGLFAGRRTITGSQSASGRARRRRRVWQVSAEVRLQIGPEGTERRRHKLTYPRCLSISRTAFLPSHSKIRRSTTSSSFTTQHYQLAGASAAHSGFAAHNKRQAHRYQAEYRRPDHATGPCRPTCGLLQPRCCCSPTFLLWYRSAGLQATQEHYTRLNAKSVASGSRGNCLSSGSPHPPQPPPQLLRPLCTAPCSCHLNKVRVASPRSWWCGAMLDVIGG